MGHERNADRGHEEFGASLSEKLHRGQDQEFERDLSFERGRPRYPKGGFTAGDGIVQRKSPSVIRP